MASHSSSLKASIASFQKKLTDLNINDLSIEGYPKQYLHSLIDNLEYYLHIYAHVLEKLLDNSPKTKEEIVLVDYGSGNGLLGMFAMYCGFKKVYLADFNTAFIDASKQLSNALNISIDAFIVGECDALADYCKTVEKPNAIIGTDVIEHIYSLENFFSCISGINKNIVSVFTTASVTANPFKNKQLMKLQHNDEHVGRNPTQITPGDEFAAMSFIEIRKKIILKTHETFTAKEVAKLCTATRGMNEKDIIAAVINFKARGVLPTPPKHPTNTCDPITGSWTERLLTIEEYRSIYQQAGFKLKVYNGFYNQWQGGVKGAALNLANKATALLGEQGSLISPFITLTGVEE